jgi:Ca2+-binding EF-hand superfamily protein
MANPKEPEIQTARTCSYSLTPEEERKIQEAYFAFAEFSEDFPDGRISFKELKKVLQNIGHDDASDEEV